MADYALAQPQQYDFAAWQTQGAQAARSRIDNTIAAAGARETIGQADALNAYRNKVKQTGDQRGSLSELNAYPEIQSKIASAIGTMSPQDQLAAADRSRKLAEAARYVGSFAPGSIEQRQAWSVSLDGLYEQGIITPEQRDYWKKQGPNDALLTQALSADQYVQSELATRKAALLTPDQRLKIEDQVNTFVKNYYGNNTYSFLTDKQVQERDKAAEAYRQKLIDEMTAINGQPSGGNLQTPVGTVTKPPAGSGSQGYSIFSPQPMARQNAPAPPATAADWKPGMPLPASHQGARRVSSPDELKSLKLPPGTPIILPNGQPVYTK